MSRKKRSKPAKGNPIPAKEPPEKKRPWLIKALITVGIALWSATVFTLGKFSGESASVLAKHETERLIVSSSIDSKPLRIQIFETPDRREWRMKATFSVFNVTSAPVGYSIESLKLVFGTRVQQSVVFPFKKNGTIPGRSTIRDSIDMPFADFPGRYFSQASNILKGTFKYRSGGEKNDYSYDFDSSMYKSTSILAAKRGTLIIPPNISKIERDSIIRNEIFGGQLFRTDSVKYKGKWRKYNISPPGMWMSWNVEKDCIRGKMEGTSKPYEDELKDYEGEFGNLVCPEKETKNRLETTFENRGERVLYQSPFVDKYVSLFDYVFLNN